MPRPRTAIGLVVAATLGLAGCGGTPEDGGVAAVDPAPTAATLPTIESPTPASGTAKATPPASSPKSALPQVTVDDVGTGAKVALASLAPAARPLLVWFWAPH